MIQVVASGSGSVTVTMPDGNKRVLDVPATPGTIDLVHGTDVVEGQLGIEVPQGVTLYSLTFG